MAKFVDENENWSDASTVPEKDVAVALYNIGLRGQDLTDLLAIAYGENGHPWKSGQIALNGRNKDLGTEDSWGIFQINRDPTAIAGSIGDVIWEQPGYESKGQAFNSLEGNMKALAVALSIFLKTKGGAVRKQRTGKGGVFYHWSAGPTKSDKKDWEARTTRAFDIANSVLPDTWNRNETRWDTLRKKTWTDALIVGEEKANIGLVQLMAGLDIDGIAGKKTEEVAEQDANGFWRLKPGIAVDPNISGQFEPGEYEYPDYESIVGEPASLVPGGGPVNWENVGLPIGTYIEETDSYIGGDSNAFEISADPNDSGQFGSEDEEEGSEEKTVRETFVGGNPEGFDPWAAGDVAAFGDDGFVSPGRFGTGEIAGSLGFLRGRSDAKVFDPRTGQEYDFVSFMESQLKGDEAPEIIAQWIDTWLPRTAWYQNTPSTVRTRIAEWYSQGMGADQDAWTGARRGKVQPFYDTVQNLMAREGFEAPEEAVWEAAKLGYFHDWDENKFIRFFSGEVVDGEKSDQGDVFFSTATSPAGNIANIKSAMRSSANSYLISMSPIEERALAKRIFTGEVPVQNISQVFREKARLLYPYLADFYDAGGDTLEFLNQFNPTIQRMLGRPAEWNGRDYSMGQAALNGDLTNLHYYRWRGGNTMDQVQMGDPGTPGEYQALDPFGRPNQVTPKQDRPLTVQEFKLALKRTSEYQQSGYALAEMGQLLNYMGAGMGATP